MKHEQITNKRFVIQGHYAELVSHTFQLVLVSYLILLLLEQIWEGVVSVYLNINYLLVIVIIVGIVDVFSEPQHKAHKKPKKSDYAFIIALGFLGFCIIKYKTTDLGLLSWLISIIAGILIILLSWLILEDDEEKKQHMHELSNKSVHLVTQKSVSLCLAALFLLSLILYVATSMTFLASLRIVFGSVYVLFIPGFIISYIFFQQTIPFESAHKKKNGIDTLERIALSFALSIAIVPLTVFYLNLVGVPITTLSTFLIILGIIAIASVLVYKKTKNKSKAKITRTFYEPTNTI